MNIKLHLSTGQIVKLDIPKQDPDVFLARLTLCDDRDMPIVGLPFSNHGGVHGNVIHTICSRMTDDIERLYF